MTRYAIPRKVKLPEEESVFDDERTKRKKADKYTGIHGKSNNPNEYTGRNIAKELRGKLYYGQKKM